MKWTNVPPTEPGWYWFQRLNGMGNWVEACIEYVYDHNIKAGHVWFGPKCNPIIAHFTIDPKFYQPGHVPEQWARWAGPIPEPNEVAE